MERAKKGYNMELSTLVKTSGEAPTFEMPFASKLTDDDYIVTINDIDISLYSGTGIATSGNSAILGTSVFVRYLGGDDGAIYLIKINATAASGDILEMFGLLEISDPKAPA